MKMTVTAHGYAFARLDELGGHLRACHGRRPSTLDRLCSGLGGCPRESSATEKWEHPSTGSPWSHPWTSFG